MKRLELHSGVLILAGLTATAIGSYIALAPLAFYEGYNLPLAGSIDMLSELRATGTNLAALGAVMVFGALKTSLRPLALATSLIVFSAFTGGRLLSLLIDGQPGSGVLLALLIEATLASLCLLAFLRHRAA
ncbi:MAG: DUF4345 domain-containing protein [Pseudomonadota bacterium]